jgi:hypothetical protein
MKRSLLLIALFLLMSNAKSQKSIDDLFSKYSGKDGYTTLTVSGNLLKFSSCSDEENNHMPSNITQIRILAQEDKTGKDQGFCKLLSDGIDLDDYEEFMRVKESDQDFRMLVKAEGRKFREFLLIAGGEDNALIQIKGEMSFDEAKKFSKDLKKNNGHFIDMDSR